MDCSKAWNLMMRHFDKENPLDGDLQLKDHLSLCEPCRIQFEALKEAFSEMTEFNDQAPADMEARVMRKLKTVKREGKLFLHLAISPLIGFLFVLAYGFYRILKTGLIAFINDLLELLTIAYKTLTAIVNVMQRLFNTFYFKQIVLLVLIIGVVYVSHAIIKNLRKEGNRLQWRVLK